MNKYTTRMVTAFPNSFGLVDNENDASHAILHEGALLLSELEREKERHVKNLSINSCDPALLSKIYFIDCADIEDMHRVNLIPQVNSGAQLTDNEVDFMSNKITGFEHTGEYLQPSGVFSSGILGIAYGFDWDEPHTYITPSGSNYVYDYTSLDDAPTFLDYAYVIQSYATVGKDEWLNINSEIAGSGIIPSGILASDTVKVAYLVNEPVDAIIIIDVGNLKNPDDPKSDGIVMNPNDYIVDGNRIVFSIERSDYISAILTTIADTPVYVYPYNYQPDKYFESMYIVEYKYRLGDNPRYLTTQDKFHDLSVVQNPKASY